MLLLVHTYIYKTIVGESKMYIEVSFKLHAWVFGETFYYHTDLLDQLTNLCTCIYFGLQYELKFYVSSYGSCIPCDTLDGTYFVYVCMYFT